MDCGGILNPLFCSFFRGASGALRARNRPDPDDDDWEILEPTADDLEADPEDDDVDWWLEDDDEEDDALPEDRAWPAADDDEEDD